MDNPLTNLTREAKGLMSPHGCGERQTDIILIERWSTIGSAHSGAGWSQGAHASAECASGSSGASAAGGGSGDGGPPPEGAYRRVNGPRANPARRRTNEVNEASSGRISREKATDGR